MRRLPWVLGLLATLLGLLPPAHAFSFGLEPSRVEMTVPVGKRRGKTITIDNTKSAAPVHLKVYVEDVIHLPDGTNNFVPAGSTDWSCAKWLTITPRELDVAAGDKGEVRISVLAPPEARGGSYAMVFFETTPSYLEAGAIGVNFRVGAFTEIVVEGTQDRKGRLAAMSFQPPDTAFINIFNDGNVLIRPKGKVKVFTQAGKRVGQVNFNPNQSGILPHTLGIYPTRLEGLPLKPGAYKVKAEIDYGAKYLLVGELPFSIQ